MLDVFPFSKLAVRGPIVRVYAVEFAEPPLLERPFDPGVSVADIIAALPALDALAGELGRPAGPQPARSAGR